MTQIVLDIEADGLNPTTVWCVVAQVIGGAQSVHRDEQSLQQFLQQHEGATLYAHNGIGYDYPVLRCLWSIDFNPFVLRDTLVLSRLASPSREGGHSLDSWGSRLGFHKLEHSDWGGFSEEMLTYCKRDVDLNVKVLKSLQSELAGFSGQSVELEHKVAEIIHRQIKHGWLLDGYKTHLLLAELRDRQYALEQEVQETFKPIPKFVKEIEPTLTQKGSVSKVGLKFLGDDYMNVCGPMSRIDWQEFNLASRKQIAERLVALGWEPKSYTPTGQPVVDEGALESATDIPEATLIAEYFTVSKRAAMVKSWLEAQDPTTGRVHGYVNSNGAVTGRMTHSNPNLAQVPASYSPYGTQCRGVWTVPDGYRLVGCDADGLELRCLAHYMNDAEYTKMIVEGKKSDGTDVHTNNQRAAGLATRDQAKTFIYAFLYGAGDAKIGSIVGRGSEEGKKLKARFLRGTPALKRLRDAVGRAAQRGYLIGIDGRKLWVRSEHSALNTLLQGAGAVVMKQALVILDEHSRNEGLEYEFIGNIHDEFQAEVALKDARRFGELAERAIIESGEVLGFRCPLTGESKIGTDWSQTH